MRIKKLFASLFCLSALILASACSVSCSGEVSEISVMNWNLETFFDGEFDGNEYSEFKSGKSGWSRDKYKVRLERAASVIKALDCDIVVVEELEKKEQLQDFRNFLSGTFDFSKVYRHVFFAAEEGASIGCGILSRLPIENVSVHSISVSGKSGQPSMRPIIKATFSLDGKKLDLFVNHWKSKSGGAEESECWRDRQEEQLSRLIAGSLDEGHGVLACGDFNRSIEEFKYEKEGEANVVLKGGARVRSPWFDENGGLSPIGSYWYDGKWEYIDNFFSAAATIGDFKCHDSGEWCDSQGHPLRYKVFSGKGYSDHLPITCRVSL